MVADASLLAKLSGQKRVKSFLTRAVEGGRAAHAYLFVGAPGSGKLEAAWALAQALLCEDGGCGACDNCMRAARRTHPDVHYYTPESATGYLISQTRELLEDVALAPIRAKHKVYIIDRAEQMRANTANALLKTIEEPPETVTFILLGTSTDTILPTIVSRCQCVPFRTLPLDESAQTVARATGVDLARCRMAIAVTVFSRAPSAKRCAAKCCALSTCLDARTRRTFCFLCATCLALSRRRLQSLRMRRKRCSTATRIIFRVEP